MLHTLVVGLGRAGAGLHLRALAKARDADGDLFGPVLGCDPDPAARAAQRGITTAGSLREAAELADPAEAVVHLCTPPADRYRQLTELAGLGYRRFVVEKPVAVDLAEYSRIAALRARFGLDIAVVAHWLDSELVERMTRLAADGVRGPLRAITFDQHKPRFQRSRGPGHPTAFDVELPHSLGVVLRLAGPAELVDAECADLRCGGQVVPRMGGARMVLRHRGGVVSELRSDLTAPVRQRQVRLEFEHGRITGHFPLSEHDHHAQLVVDDGLPEVFADDALTRFVRRAHRHFATGGGAHGTFELHGEVVELTGAAKQHCRPVDRPVREVHRAPALRRPVPERYGA